MAQPRRAQFPGRWSRRAAKDELRPDLTPPLHSVSPDEIVDAAPPLPKATRGWLLALLVSLVVWGAVVVFVLRLF